MASVDPQYTYEELVTRARCGQHTLRQCLLVIEGLKSHLQIAAALAEVTISPEARTGAVAQYIDDFEYIFSVLEEVVPDAERVADKLWEGPDFWDEDDPRPELRLITCSKLSAEELHAPLDGDKAVDDVVHLRLIDDGPKELES